jgi:D-alanyl-D-alanine carboxypeptidase
MSVFQTGFCTLATLLFVAASSARVARADAVDDYIKVRMAREHIPGLSLVVIRDGKIIKAKGYGRASLELNVPATPDTVYELASTTKPFMAAAILLLAQDGKLALEDKVSKFVENTPDAWKDITIRHLLSHTSGIKDYLADLRQDFPHDTPPEKIVKAAMEQPLNFAPGEKWAYSNTGYVLLGIIVQKVSGMTYDALLQERIFQPLGMMNTRRDTPDEMVPNRAVGYLWFGTFRNVEFLRYLMTNHGDRGILSTVRDLAKWDAALSDTQLFTAATRKAMWTPVITFDGGASQKMSYGLGWFLKNVNGHRQISHPGGAPGTAAIISRYPDDNLTVILLANGGRAFPQALDLGIARHYIPGLMTSGKVRLRPALLDSCTGYYNAYGSQLLRVARDTSGLYLNDSGGVNNEFLPVSDTRFLAEEADRAFTVTRDANGNVTGAMLRLGKDEMAVQRIGPLARTLAPQTDPDPTLTRRITEVLKALGQGGKAVEDVALLAPQARKDFSFGREYALVGMRDISYIAARDIAAQGIERHGAKVSHILYYKLLTDRGTRYVLVYLTNDGQVTDEDVVEE